MDALLRFLQQYELIFYAVTGILVLVYARKVYLAWKEWSEALFGLEKETSQRKINQGLTILIFSGLLGLGLFLVNTFITPSVPGVQQLPTPTVDVTAEPELLTELTPTVMLTTEGLIPTLQKILDQGCISDQIEWTYPLDGGYVSGKVILKGTVNVLNLGYYKVEYRPVDGEDWTTIMGGHDKIIDSPFGGSWDTRNLEPGDYQFRLVVFDNQQEELPDCSINVLIKASE